LFGLNLFTKKIKDPTPSSIAIVVCKISII